MNLNLRKFIFALAGASNLFLLSAATGAQFLSFSEGDTLIPGSHLGGTIQTSGWDDLTSLRLGTGTGYGHHGSKDPWDKSIAANHGVTSASLYKTGGYGFVAPGSIHQGYPGYVENGEGGHFVVSDVLIDNAATIVFQIHVTDAHGYTFYEPSDGEITYPLLNIGSEIEARAADWTAIVHKEEHPDAGWEDVPQYSYYWAFQWDLSGLDFTENADFSIDWTGVVNSGIYGLQLDQSDQFAQVIPEPGTYALMIGALVLAVVTLRRRQGSR